MAATKDGTCCVCSGAMPVGTAIRWWPARKVAWHDGCAAPEGASDATKRKAREERPAVKGKPSDDAAPEMREPGAASVQPPVPAPASTPSVTAPAPVSPPPKAIEHPAVVAARAAREHAAELAAKAERELVAAEASARAEQEKAAREQAEREEAERAAFSASKAAPGTRPMALRKVADLFKVALPGEVLAYERPDTLTPAIDPAYQFKADDVEALLVAMKVNDRVFLRGHTGTGKTTLIKQIAARLNYNVVLISFDAQLGRDEIIGSRTVEAGSIVFSDGAFTSAVRNVEGCFIILDEFDGVGPDVALAFQGPLDKADGTLAIPETAERLAMKPHTFLFATGNTNGQGDATGLYAGTRPQNLAQYNRFGTTLVVGYPDAKTEASILRARFPGLPSVQVSAIVKVANAAREAFAQGTLGVPVSVRDTVAWAEKAQFMALPGAAKLAFLNRMNETDAATVAGFLARL